MPTPFICRQCIARLAKSSTRRPESKRSRLHTQGLQTPNPPAGWLFPAGRNFQQDQEGGVAGEPEKPQILWDGELKRYVPHRRPDVKQLVTEPRATTPHELKVKILRAFGEYRIVHEDLMYIYNLSHQEARHAAGQLERLLRGYLVRDAGIRLDLFHNWKKNFRSLSQMVDRLLLDSKTHTSSDEKVAWACLQEQDPAIMRAAWHKLPQDRRESLWPQMILSAFNSNPSGLSSFIRATFHPSWSPSYIVEDVVYFLCRVSETGVANEKMKQDLASLVMFLLKICPPRYMNLEQVVIRRVISLMPTSSLVELYELLKRAEHPLHQNTLLHFASRFAKVSEYKENAAELLYSLMNVPGFDINSPVSASVCTSLLTLDNSDTFPDGRAAPDLLLKLLMDGGYRPNILGLSALMRNFCVRGHIETAWQIFDLLLQHGITPDPHVYSILLNGSKHTSDVTTIRTLTRAIISHSSWTVVLANDFLNLIFRENGAQNERRRRQRKKANNAWRPMLQVYTKLFHLAPLQKLTLFPLENLFILGGQPPNPKYSTYLTSMAAIIPPQPKHLLTPDSVTLLTMLGAHMQSINGPRNIRRYYRHFMQLLRKGDPVALKLIEDQGTRLYDIFIRAIMQFRNSVRFGMGIVTRMMMRANREQKRLGGGGGGRNERFPPPSVHTWTILLNGFKNHGHMRGAVGVLNMMITTGGVQPNLVTWNALITAFARVGNVAGAVRAMRYLEQAGFHSDDRTVAAFQLLSKPQREHAIRLLEKSRHLPVDPRDPRAFLEDLRPRSGVAGTEAAAAADAEATDE
ncbi:hypothetical protein F5B20DRAFT_567945 [Whalleya microplaca]|nr:hypothetical protein F5B20DRAFT_567945 [Whalleya microplaca]